jgi:hypothetical protein
MPIGSTALGNNGLGFGAKACQIFGHGLILFHPSGGFVEPSPRLPQFI